MTAVGAIILASIFAIVIVIQQDTSSKTSISETPTEADLPNSNDFQVVGA